MFTQKQLELYEVILSDLVSVTQAASLKQVNESSIRKAIRTKRLRIAKKIGATHLVSSQEVSELTIIGHRPRKSDK